MGWRSSFASALTAMIALVFLPVVTNLQANALPAWWAKHPWISWLSGILLAAPLVFLNVRQRLHNSGRDGVLDETSAGEQLDCAAAALAVAVKRQWTEEARLRLVGGSGSLRVRWSTTSRPVAAHLRNVLTPGTVPPRPLAVRGEGTLQICALLDRLRDRQLVILGAPGAGKSVLALLFALHQLEHRTPEEPVPVLLSVSSWNPDTDHLHTWLARRVAEEYPALGNRNEFGANAPQRLVTEGRMIAVLDGLDEMPACMRPVAIEAINRAAAPEHPVVVTCRSAEYEAAVAASGAFLNRAAVLEIQPLDLAAASDFLTASVPARDNRWQQVLAELRTRPAAPLVQVLASPLMVSLACTIYSSPTSAPGDLLDTARFTEPSEIERHLLGGFIPAAFRAAPANPGAVPARGGAPFPAERARTWLEFLARQSNTGDLAWWQLADAVPRSIVALYNGVLAGLVFGAYGGLRSGPVSFAVWSLVFGAAAAFSSAFGRLRGPTQLQVRFRAKAIPFFRIFAAGCAVGLGLALAFRQPVFPAIGSGLVLGLAFASRVWLDVPSDAAAVPTARTSIAQNRTATLFLALTLAASFGLFNYMGFTKSGGLSLSTASFTVLLITMLGGAAAGGVTGYFAYGRVGGIAFGLAAAIAAPLTLTGTPGLADRSIIGVESGIGFGLAIGTMGVLSRAWGRFALARIWLALSGHLPWRLMRFFEDAHQNGVLRQSGAAYQFRHIKLRDHLANADPANNPD